MKKAITVTIEKDQFQSLRDISDKKVCYVSDLVRTLINEFVDQETENVSQLEKVS